MNVTQIGAAGVIIICCCLILWNLIVITVKVNFRQVKQSEKDLDMYGEAQKIYLKQSEDLTKDIFPYVPLEASVKCQVGSNIEGDIWYQAVLIDSDNNAVFTIIANRDEVHLDIHGGFSLDSQKKINEFANLAKFAERLSFSLRVKHVAEIFHPEKPMKVKEQKLWDIEALDPQELFKDDYDYGETSSGEVNNG